MNLTIRLRACARTAVQSVLCFALVVLLSGIRGFADTSRPSSEDSFLLVTDIHFNPMADATLVSQLQTADPTQWEAILSRSKPTAFSQYGQDTNWWLLQSAMKAMAGALPHPPFILMTGDSLAHQFPETYNKITHDSDHEHYHKFVLNTMKFLALEFSKTFPHTKVFFTPGNNDAECGDYSIDAGGRFLHDTADTIRNLAQGDDQLRASWEALGSYDVPHPTIKNFRLISLNTVFWSNAYQARKYSTGCAVAPSKAPAETMQWLESRLEHAKTAHEKVWLMFHIPPGIDGFSSLHRFQALAKQHPPTEQLCDSAILPMWAPSWNGQFERLLHKYHGTVSAIFAAHTHNDNFQVIFPSSAESMYVLISPAISPIYNQNPSFRVVTFAANGAIKDATVYYLKNLIYASSTTAGDWQREYSFSQIWKAQQIDATSLSQLYDGIKSDERVRNEWLKLLNVSSSAVHLLPGSSPGLYCADEAFDRESYSRCYCRTVIPHSTDGETQ